MDRPDALDVALELRRAGDARRSPEMRSPRHAPGPYVLALAGLAFAVPTVLLAIAAHPRWRRRVCVRCPSDRRAFGGPGGERLGFTPRIRAHNDDSGTDGVDHRSQADPPFFKEGSHRRGHWVWVDDPIDTGPPTPPPKNATHGPVYQRANTWDLNIDGAFGRYLGDEPKWTGFVRARAGLLFVREPMLYYALGLTYEYSNLSNATFGVQAEILHLDSGFWGQAGALLDTNGHPGAMVAAGYSLIGLEAQYRTYDGGLGDGIAVYAKLRVPVGVLAYLLGHRDAKPKEPATP